MTFKLEQAADYLCLHPETVRERAKSGIIPASKPGRRWVFLQHELEAYLKQCRCTAGGTLGGSTSSIGASECARVHTAQTVPCCLWLCPAGNSQIKQETGELGHKLGHSACDVGRCGAIVVWDEGMGAEGHTRSYCALARLRYT